MGRGCCVGAERGAGRSRVPVLQLITLGGAAQMVTSSGTKGNVITSSLAGALAVMVAIYTAGGVSGEAGGSAAPLGGLCSVLPAPLPAPLLPHPRGPPEPGFLPRHVPAGAAPVVEVPHLRGRADLRVLHRRRSRLCSVLRYTEPAEGPWGGRAAGGAPLPHGSAPQTPSGPTAMGPSPPPGHGRRRPSSPPTPLSTSPSPTASWTRWVPAL